MRTLLSLTIALMASMGPALADEAPNPGDPELAAYTQTVSLSGIEARRVDRVREDACALARSLSRDDLGDVGCDAQDRAHVARGWWAHDR